MNKKSTMSKNESQLSFFDQSMVEALAHFLETDKTLHIKSIEYPSTKAAQNQEGDLQLVLQIQGHRQRYTTLVKKQLRNHADLARYAAQTDGTEMDRRLLLTPYITQAMADACVDAGIQFIDLAGNRYLSGQRHYILVTGKPPSKMAQDLTLPTHSSNSPGGTTNALRVVFSILTDPVLLNQPYRVIAGAAGVALGSVGPILADLKQRMMISDDFGRGERTMTEIMALSQEWTLNYPLRLRPKLNAQRFSSTHPAWWKNTTLPANQAWWSGEVAAALLSKDLNPVTQTIYVLPEVRAKILSELVLNRRLRADRNGSIEILDAFWRPVASSDTTIAPLLLIYADLYNMRESRAFFAAQKISLIMRGRHETHLS